MISEKESHFREVDNFSEGEKTRKGAMCALFSMAA